MAKINGPKTENAFWGITAISALLGLGGIINIFFSPLSLGLPLAAVIGGTIVVLILGYRKSAPLFSVEERKNREIERITESVKDGIVSYRPDFTITSINSAACDITGIRKERIIRKKVTPESVNDNELRKLAQIIFPSLAPNAVTISAADVWPHITEITLEEPREELRTTTHQITDEEGNLAGFIKIIQNRTRETAMIKLKSDFIQVAAHQLRTPLTAIGWSLENLTALLKDEKPEAAQAAREIQELAQRSLKITNDLLDTARIEEGKFDYNLEKTDLKKIIEEVVQTARKAAESRGVSIIVDFSPEPILIQADLAKLSTALLNIVDNAIRYNVPQGKIGIEARKEGENANITIKDSGIGIPEKDQEKIFEKMYRGSNAAAQEPNGSGLGLFIAKNIIKGHRGAIHIESIEKRGTTVGITLPLAS